MAIGSGAVGDEQDEARQQLLGNWVISQLYRCLIHIFCLELWKGVEQLITEGKVGGAGLCDLHPPVFVSIYQQATVKPISIQVRI